jgi:HNH endonuclease
MKVYISVELQRRVRERFANCCAYCHTAEALTVVTFEFEHIVPRSAGGATEFDNLCLACPTCNNFKGDQTTAVDPETNERVALFNPRTNNWFEHFRWSEDGLRILGLTPIGRATVVALHLSDDPDALTVRGYWVLAGWHPPSD